MKALRVSVAHVSYESEIVAKFNRFCGRPMILPEAQIRLIDTCAERLDFNAKKKGK